MCYLSPKLPPDLFQIGHPSMVPSKCFIRGPKNKLGPSLLLDNQCIEKLPQSLRTWGRGSYMIRGSATLCSVRSKIAKLCRAQRLWLGWNHLGGRSWGMNGLGSGGWISKEDAWGWAGGRAEWTVLVPWSSRCGKKGQMGMGVGIFVWVPIGVKNIFKGKPFASFPRQTI